VIVGCNERDAWPDFLSQFILHCHVSLVDQELCVALTSGYRRLILYTLCSEALPYGTNNSDRPRTTRALVNRGWRSLESNPIQSDMTIMSVVDCMIFRRDPHGNVLEVALDWVVQSEATLDHPRVVRSSAQFVFDDAQSGALWQTHGKVTWHNPAPAYISASPSWPNLMTTDWNGLFTLQLRGRMESHDEHRELVLIDTRRSSDGTSARCHAQIEARSRSYGVDISSTHEDARYCVLSCPEGLNLRRVTSLRVDAAMGVVYLLEGRILHRLSYA
jgi:hypothetical protein